MAGYVKINNTSDNVKMILNSSDVINGEIQGYFPLLEKKFSAINKLVQGGEFTQEEESLINVTPINFSGLIYNVNSLFKTTNNLSNQIDNINKKISASTIQITQIDCGSATELIE